MIKKTTNNILLSNTLMKEIYIIFNKVSIQLLPEMGGQYTLFGSAKSSLDGL
jgi:hypothetical protein